MRTVDLAGDWHEIGEQHGRVLAAEIGEHLRRWHGALAGRGVADVGRWVADLSERTGYVDAVRASAPELADEVEGIAVGAGIGPADAWLLQMLDESWAHLDRREGLGAGIDGGLGCTSFGVVNGARSWSGQTMDLEGFRRGLAVMLRIRPTDRPTQLVLSMPGCVGLTGASQAGFGVLVNALAQVPASGDGVPVSVVTRSALAAGGYLEAIEAVRSGPHATGQHYLVMSSERIASFECSPVGVVPVTPEATRCWHTNHPLVGYVPEPDDAESERRWEAARPVLGLPGWGLRRSQELLTGEPIWRRLVDESASCTFAALVIEHASWGTDVWANQGRAWEQVPW
jgi:hypothetical protein